MLKSYCRVVVILILVIFISNFSFAVTRHEYVDSLEVSATRDSKQKGREFIALATINKAIKFQPKRVELYYKRAFINGRAGQYLVAIKDFNKFVKNKRYPHAIRFRADCFMALGDMKRAVKDYSVFLKNNPKDGKVWSYMAEALALMGQKEAALDATRRGLATGSHWSARLQELQMNILVGKKIDTHKPLSN